MKTQQIHVYARFINDDEAAPETTRTGAGKARRAARRSGSGARSPKQGLKKRSGLPK